MEIQAVTSKGCARGYMVFVLWHAWQHVRHLKSEDIGIVFPFDDDAVLTWIEKARDDCSHNRNFIAIFGGTEFDANDASTFWTSSSNFYTWWKNNIERKTKFSSLAKDAVTREDMLMDPKRPAYCREIIALATNIRNHFDRIIHRTELPYIPQVTLPYPLPAWYQLTPSVVQYKYMSIETHICEMYPGLTKLVKKYRPAAKRTAAVAVVAVEPLSIVPVTGYNTPIHDMDDGENEGEGENDGEGEFNPPPPPAKRRKPNHVTSGNGSRMKSASSSTALRLFDTDTAAVDSSADRQPHQHEQQQDDKFRGIDGRGGGRYRTRAAVRNKDHHHHTAAGPSLCNLDSMDMDHNNQNTNHYHQHWNQHHAQQQGELATHFDDHFAAIGDFDTMFAGSSSAAALSSSRTSGMMPSMSMSMSMPMSLHDMLPGGSGGNGSSAGLISLPVKFRSNGNALLDDSGMGSSGIDDRSNCNDVYCGYVLVPVNRVSVSAVMGAGFAPGGFITPPSYTPVPIRPASSGGAWNNAVTSSPAASTQAATNDWQPLLEASAFDRYQPPSSLLPKSADSSKGRSNSKVSPRDSDEMSIESSTQMMSKITMRSRPSSSAAGGVSMMMMPSAVSRTHFVHATSSHSSLGMNTNLADNDTADIDANGDTNDVLCCDVDNDLINAYLADIRSDHYAADIGGGGEASTGQVMSEGSGAAAVEEEVIMHDYLQCFLPINEPVNFRDEHHHDIMLGGREEDEQADDENAANALLRLHDGLARTIDAHVYTSAEAEAEYTAGEDGAEDTRMEF